MEFKFYFIISAFSIVLLTPQLFAQQEPETGQYDPVNDWFVFKYVSPEYGDRKFIFDPTNKVDPLVEAFVVWDYNTGGYVYYYRVSNGNKAKQVLSRVVIKFFSVIYTPTAPDKDWYMGEHRTGRADTWKWFNPEGISPGQIQDGFFLQK